MLHGGVLAGGLRLAVVVCLLLILAGNVEKNPGPRGKRGVTDTMFRPERTTWQTTLFGATGGSSEPRESHTLMQIESLHKEVMDLRELVEKCVETVERLENKNAELRERHERMENQNRWDNLVFYGIPESDRERGKKVRKRYGTMLLNILIWAEPKPTWNSRLNELTVLERDHLEE